MAITPRAGVRRNRKSRLDRRSGDPDFTRGARRAAATAATPTSAPAPHPKLWSYRSVLHRGHRRPVAHQCFRFRSRDGLAFAWNGDAGAVAPRTAPADSQHGRQLSHRRRHRLGNLYLPVATTVRSRPALELCCGTAPLGFTAGGRRRVEPRGAVSVELPSYSKDTADRRLLSHVCRRVVGSSLRHLSGSSL